MPFLPQPVTTWPSLRAVPALYPDARNRPNRFPLLYQHGRMFPLPQPLNVEGRLAILAVGSNAYPRQLSDKLRGTAADLEGIPLLPALLRGFDAAFCPVVGRSGYVPLTLAARPGAVALTWLQYLTPAQLDLISRTEGSRYTLVQSPQLAAALTISSAAPRPQTVAAWWFDSLLQVDGATLWHDPYRRPLNRPIAPMSAVPNPVPDGWELIPR